MMEVDTLQEWSQTLIEGLVDAGVTEVVVSPGSRSTPFLLAALAHPQLRCTHVVDERAAAFYAVGRAKVSGHPPVLLCTSGSASAHYWPAIVEASASFTPLLVVSSDRPFEHQSCGAAQTIDLVKIFGSHGRAYFDLGTPIQSDTALRAVRRIARQAVFTAFYPTPGAVHINARADKPLEPSTLKPAHQSDGSTDHRWRRLAASSSVPTLAPNATAVREIAGACATAKRGLIVVGNTPIVGASRLREQVIRLAERTGFPIVCDVTSQLRLVGVGDKVAMCDRFDVLMQSAAARAAVRPDLVIQLNASPFSASWETFTRSLRGCARIVITPHGWQDPDSSADLFVAADVAATLEAVIGQSELGDRRDTERDAWRNFTSRLNSLSGHSIRSELDQCGEFTDAAAAREAVTCLPRGAILALGNSLPIRQVESYCGFQPLDVAVWSQRGANGIDGLIAGAAGAADAAKRPVLLMIGDVSFLHDLGGLALAKNVGAPLVILILNNGGGRIFEQLPVAQIPGLESLLDFWTTPHAMTFESAAALFALPYAHAVSAAELRASLDVAFRREGCSVVEARIAPGAAAAQSRRLRKRLDAALQGEL